MEKIVWTDKHIVVVGDAILDEYVYGICDRISPEAPVPVIQFERSELRLGGVLNVAANIAALGGNVRVVGVIGKAGVYTCAYVQGLIIKSGISGQWLIHSDSMPHKTRIIANGQQVARLDCERKIQSRDAESALIGSFLDATTDMAAVIMSDYGKGAITRSLFDCVIETANWQHVPVLLDPKVSNAKAYPSHVTVMTPNTDEAEGLTNISIRDAKSLEDVGRTLIMRYGAKHILVTRGKDGMTLFSSPEEGMLSSDIEVSHIAADAKQVFDVSGAGDTVIATFALAYASGYTPLAAAKMANHAAGIVVAKPGTATVSLSELAAI